MTEVQTPCTGAAAGVEKEGLALLIRVQDLVEITMAEEQAAPEPAMSLVAGELLKPVNDSLVKQRGVPFSARC